MKKILFLTSEDLVDVDMPVVKVLNNKYKAQFNITWIIILRGYGWFSKQEITEFCESNKIQYLLFEEKRKLKNPTFIFFYLKLLKIIKGQHPDIIYDSVLGVPYMHLLRGAYLKKEKFVIAIHDVVQHYKMKNRMVMNAYFSFVMKTYMHFHVFSDSQLRMFKSLYPGKKSFCSPLFLKNFGDMDSIDHHKGQQTKNFLFFGIIRPNKGLDILIEAANLLVKRELNFHITIAGKCENWEQYESRIENKALFTLNIGNVDKEDVPSLFANAHFSVLPYRDVTQSGVLLSSYNYLVPVIASRLEWFEEYTDDQSNGYLFDQESVKDLADKMEMAIWLSNDQYQSMVNNLRQFVEDRINIDKIVKNYAVFFEAIN